MNKSAKFRFFITLLMLISLVSPTAVLARGEGKKHFKQGLKHEVAEEWDKAVEEFALAIADNPKNPEYRLHYRRALFNASQMFMKRGRMLAEEKDYEGAFIAFRKSYGFDPVNELAKSEMARMLRLQKALINGDTEVDESGEVKLVKTSLNDQSIPEDVVIPQRYEVLRNVTHPNPFPLQTLIRTLAESLDLNVLFDSASRLDNKKIKIELKNVTSAQALDALFLQENLFFEKVGPRTIIVASSTRRQFFQQLVLRTFYLGNADPKKVAAIIQKAIPAQPGRTPTIVLTDEDTNSLTIRDTAENIRLMSGLIKSLDKDRAEVVMDVQIYEVSKEDLLNFGNQIGSESSLTTLGGTTRGVVGLGGNDIFGALTNLPTAFGAGLILPSANLVAFQRKGNTKLIASTQIHAFNNEDSSARIGQRVPVQTASVSQFNGTNNTNTGNNVFGTGFPVINYEQTGLTLKFKPIVFPNQDVQVAMEIESKEVVNRDSPTPTFTERTIKGTARIQNNKTLLLASVAQGIESKGREGIPLLGLIPILGRLFTAPTKSNSQTDIVIAVTPRVIRAPAILPEDLEPKNTGSLAVPTSGSLSELLVREEVQRQQNLARLEKRNPTIQLPDGTADDVPTYVKSTGNETVSSNQSEENITETKSTEVSKKTLDLATTLRPIDSKNVRTLDITKTGNPSANENSVKLNKTSLKEDVPVNTSKVSNLVRENAASAILQMMPKFSELKAGEKTKIAVMVRSATPFRSGVLGLRFDDSKVAIRTVEFGDVFGSTLAQTPAKPFINQGGKMYVTLSSPTDVAQNSSGILAYVEIEALVDGTPDITFEADMVTILSASGENFLIRF
jgi:general secretion pathway protein D